VGSGFRFRLVSEPSDGDVLGTIVFVHAFAEEMNKSRRMAARMARLLAADGWRVVQRDLCGCGDSSGDFADATWDDWLGDVDAELTQAADGRPAWLWCERAGALLASPMLAKHPRVHLLLWQPVLSGAQHLQQFLRLDAGARIVGSTKAGSGQTPIERLRAGEGVEVGGYGLSPALALGLDRASFDVPASFAGRVVWFELSMDDAAEPSLPATRLLERLRANGIAVEMAVLRGPPFWQTQEIEESEALLDSTGAALRATPTSPELPPGRPLGTGCVVVDGVSR
jgi:exosortase A-associated hydrolase 2